MVTSAQRASDRVTLFFGSWSFVAWLALFGWIDPWPFIFYNLVLTVFSTYQGPLIMMSQNRQADRDREAVAELRGLLLRVLEKMER